MITRAPLNLQNIPAELRELAQFVGWKWETRNGKSTKPPFNVATGAYASVDKPGTWSSYDTACTAMQSGGYGGLGFVLTESDPYAGVDLDKCRDPETGAITPEAQAIIERLSTYTEVSPSGTGLRLIAKGSVPSNLNQMPPSGGRREMYSSKRYLTLTGAHVAGTPRTIEERAEALSSLHAKWVTEHAAWTRRNGTSASADPRPQPSTEREQPVSSSDDMAVLERAFKASNGPAFAALWNGDWKRDHGSQSEADLALCNHLAFYTGKDPGRMDRLFRQSGLMREKWDEKHSSDGSTYGAMTIRRAIAGTREVYTPGGRSGYDSTPTPAVPGRPAIPGAAVLVNMGDVEEADVDWLWYGRLAKGKLTLLVGDGGDGKSNLLLDIAARITRLGARWADGEEAPDGSVILLTAEDGLADTIAPRLSVLGADKRKIHALTAVRPAGKDARQLSLDSDIAALDSALQQTNAIAVLIDPLSAYLGKTDSWKDADIRRVLTPLVAMAEARGVAVVGIMHLNKAAGVKTLHRVLGSVAFAAAARIVLGVARDDQDPERRYVVNVKENLSRKAAALAYRLEEICPKCLQPVTKRCPTCSRYSVPRLAWEEGEHQVDVEKLFAGPPQRQSSDNGSGGSPEQAVEFLQAQLTNGPLLQRDLVEAGKALGIDSDQLWRAKTKLGLAAKKSPKWQGPWAWYPPGKGPEDYPDYRP